MPDGKADARRFTLSGRKRRWPQPVDDCSALKIKPLPAVSRIVSYEESIGMLFFGLGDMVLIDY